jgi:2-keto-4-pentenoate hydratase/2-oxohepta-3-ene-1,7-dioic acid hydratase in catechol pathway
VRLVQYRRRGQAEAKVGIVRAHRVQDPAVLWAREHSEPFPRDAVALLAHPARSFCEKLVAEGDCPPDALAGWTEREEPPPCHHFSEVQLLSPLLHPVSFRDFYCFEEHVRKARARRGLTVPDEWYERPTFYFSNPRCLLGPEEEVSRPASTRALDLEAEIGCIISRRGRDISVEAAGSYIAGYTLLNDWSARDVQRREMTVGLGPSKGKDFATSLGPFLVTPDELASLRAGKGYDIGLEVRRNGRLLLEGTWRSIQFSFEEMISHASRDADLFPGDLLGSGAVGGGSIMEIGPEDAGGYLEPGEEIEISGGPLGVLRSRIR